MNVYLSALKALAYFDIFNYPLTRDEILLFMDRPIEGDELEIALDQMTASKQVFHFNGYYTLKNGRSDIDNRRKGNQKAAGMMPTAYHISRFLYRFPFVRGIGISGSLSKNFADENADIDYFIITSANRLWLARTLLHLYKKLTFLTGKQHWYCMNYFIDEQALTIQEKNVFTAIEVLTLIPVCGNGSLKKFFEANEWTCTYCPNYIVDTAGKRNAPFPWYKKTIEKILNNALADRLDNYLMQLTIKRWRHKEEKGMINGSGRKMGMHAQKHFSKPNPHHLQRHILHLYEKNVKALSESVFV